MLGTMKILWFFFFLVTVISLVLGLISKPFTTIRYSHVHSDPAGHSYNKIQTSEEIKVFQDELLDPLVSGIEEYHAVKVKNTKLYF